MNKRKLNKKSIRLLILILGLIVLVVSTSYAVFSIRHENSNNQIISAGELELTYNSCSTMTTEMVPMSNEDGMGQTGCNVTVENTGSLDAIYKVLIYNNSSGSNHLSHDNLYVSIDNSTPVLLSTITKLESTDKYNLKEDVLLVGNTRSHNIKMWIKEDATTDIVGKSVNLIVDIEAVVLEEIPGSYEYVYTGTAQEFTVPATGYYEIKLWGASGGDYYSTGLGKGGFTQGMIYLSEGERIYIYIGGAGIYNGQPEIVFNGGGAGGLNLAETYKGNTGGGGTDVRIISGTWAETTSLRSRIMVAGAGGGAGHNGYTYTGIIDLNNSSGGGLIGRNGTYYNGHGDLKQYGAGGNQTTGGIMGINTFNPVLVSSSEAGFGIGGWNYSKSESGIGTSGGGSGYYGGGAAGATGGGGGSNGAGGGSSYISGYAGVNSVQETGGTAAQPLHTNNTIHYSGKYFLNGSMEAGVNSGNGKAKITYIGTEIPERTNTNLDNVRYIKNCINGSSMNSETHWVEIQAIKDGINVAYGKTVTGNVAVNSAYPYSRITDGKIDGSTYATTSVYTGIRCVTADLGEEYDLDEVGLWLYYTDGRRYYNNTLSIGSSNPGNTTTASLSTVLHTYTGTNGYNETSQGKRYTAWD